MSAAESFRNHARLLARRDFDQFGLEIFKQNTGSLGRGKTNHYPLFPDPSESNAYEEEREIIIGEQYAQEQIDTARTLGEGE
jgi:hypothetical protein